MEFETYRIDKNQYVFIYKRYMLECTNGNVYFFKYLEHTKYMINSQFKKIEEYDFALLISEIEYVFDIAKDLKKHSQNENEDECEILLGLIKEKINQYNMEGV